jgi:DNA-binding response OmpR family regulator
VPASRQSSTRTASQHNILLLEQYDALGAAIASALRKFAPEHSISRSTTLKEAEKLATEIGPELFVIDVDPPWRGITDFLEKMREAQPTARAVILGAGIPPTIAAERGSFGALQFISKPFELAAFGAAVQAVLGPWRESEANTTRGSLGELDAIDICLLHYAAAATVTLEVSANAKRSGRIHFASGQPVHAETGKSTGIDALNAILSWTKCHVSEVRSAPPKNRTIDRDWPDLVVELLRERKSVPRVKAPTPSAPAKIKKAGKKIVVVDDTEMLLIFVEDVLTTADPELQITTAATGTEGVKEIERVRPDLVLLDYSLPDLNGDEVCRRLLQNENTARLPVLMMSGHVAEMKAAASTLENVVATIEKPFLSEALIQLVKQTLTAGPRVAKPIKAREVIPAPPPPAPLPPPPVQPTTPVPPRQEPAPRVESPTTITPSLAPSEFEVHRRMAEPATMPVSVAPTVRVAAGEKNDAVLGLYLEVISMQLTPQLQMGAIRAKPTGAVASLQLSSAAAQSAIGRTGFKLGPTSLDANGRIAALRLIPTSQPFQAAQTRVSFEIGGVAVIPNQLRARVQLTPAGTTPMTIEMLVHLELAAVELSQTFQVAQLILNSRSQAVRVTLDPKAPHTSGSTFEASMIKLDSAGRIAELVLSPIR